MVSALETRRRALMFQPHRAMATGAIASFRTDVLSPLKMSFDLLPVQDLHGQSNPYPPGGGKNLLQLLTTETTTSNSVTFTVNADGTVSTQGTASGTAVFRHYMTSADLPNNSLILNGTPSGGSWTTTYGMAFCSSSGSVIGSADSGNGSTISAERLSELAQIQIVIRSGTNANGLVFKPMIRLASVTDGTFAPYSNICPITGHDGFTRTGTGKNLLPQTNYNTQYFTVASDGSVTQNNPSSAPFTWAYSQSIMRVTLPPGKYTITETLTKAVTNSNHTVRTMDDKENARGIVNGAKNVGTYSGTFTLTKWTNLGVVVKLYDGVAKFSITPGETAQPYEPFGHSYSTTFPTPPGTVYGGHVTDNGDGTGTLVVDKVCFVPSVVSSIGTASTGVKYISTLLPTGMNAKAESIYNECISSEYKFRVSAPSDSGWFRVHPNNIFIFDDRFTSKETAESILADEKPQFVYELATPVQYTLSLTALQSLIGQNHVWVDNADEVSVEYWGH